MSDLSPFTLKIRSLPKYFSDEQTNSAILVKDNLEIAWATAITIFGDRATPEHALEICKMIIVNNKTEK